MNERDNRSRPWPFTSALAADHMLYSLGLFSLMPVLPVLLAALQRGASTAFVGNDLFVYTAAAGVGSLPFSKWLQRLPYDVTLSAGLFLSGAGFGALSFVRNPLALLGALLLAGFGYSVHLVFSRVLITEMVAQDVARHRIYSILQIAVNVSAAFGPFVAVYLYSLGHGRVLLGGVAACYALAGLTVLLRIPHRLAPPPASTQWAISRATFRMVLHDRRAVHIVLSTAVGSFLYAQFYSAFTLMVARQVDPELLRAVLLAVPASSIVVAQTGVSWMVGKALTRGIHVSDVLILATVVFGIAMLALGAGVSVVADAWAGVCVFSCAEMLFSPTVSTAFGTLPSTSRLEAFNLRQVSWTLGEAVGAWCGGSVFLYCLDQGIGQIYWSATGAVTLLGMSALVLTARVTQVSAPASDGSVRLFLRFFRTDRGDSC